MRLRSMSDPTLKTSFMKTNGEWKLYLCVHSSIEQNGVVFGGSSKVVRTIPMVSSYPNGEGQGCTSMESNVEDSRRFKKAPIFSKELEPTIWCPHNIKFGLNGFVGGFLEHFPTLLKKVNTSDDNS